MPDSPPDSLADYIRRSRVALALSTVTGDVPLLMVNQGFCDLTGYERDQVEGRNCRLLQGPGTDAESRAALRAFVNDSDRDSGRFPILNYRADGSAFHNLLFMTRLRDHAGQARYLLASQFDMTSSAQRNTLPAHDAELSRNLSEIRAMGQQFGLAMEGSAKAISQSVAMLARLHFDE